MMTEQALQQGKEYLFWSLTIRDMYANEQHKVFQW